MSTPQPALIVPVGDLARRLGLPQPLDENDRWTVEQAISDAQSDLEAYLGRPVTPRTYTEAVFTGWGDACWQDLLIHQPLISITSTTADIDPISGQPTGRTAVTYLAGLDGAADPELKPLRRFVTAHATFSDTVLRLLTRLDLTPPRRIKTLSVEGQGVGYTDDGYDRASKGGAGTAGALPTLASCARWRIAGRGVTQGPTESTGTWPYDGDRSWYSGQWNW